MTIGKKLYVSFGIILTTVVVLFLVNWSAVQREHTAKASAAAVSAAAAMSASAPAGDDQTRS